MVDAAATIVDAAATTIDVATTTWMPLHRWSMWWHRGGCCSIHPPASCIEVAAGVFRGSCLPLNPRR
jgi:hypothetical protein